MHVCMFWYTCMLVCFGIHVCLYVLVSMYACLCVLVYMYACMYVLVYMYACMFWYLAIHKLYLVFSVAGGDDTTRPRRQGTCPIVFEKSAIAVELV
jgi:hypothetical protein